MAYMAAHGLKRARPAELLPGTVSVITARMDYLPASRPAQTAMHTLPTDQPSLGRAGSQACQALGEQPADGCLAADWQALELARLQRPSEAIVSLYARGRDYHKVLRGRLQRLSERMAAELNPSGWRVFCDSAPVLEVELASRSGLGWRGKHTLLLNRQAGSMFFLGDIFVDVALPPTAPVAAHCGSCSACLTACPTQAIVAPYRLDARRCLSYLTIEHAGPIAPALRPLLGNRIYGCDDCQLVCPWNKFAKPSPLPDFAPRAGLTGSSLAALFGWTEDEFLRFTEGSPIRRIGHLRWLRNIAVALGNALRAASADAARQPLRQALYRRLDHPSALVREHVVWALRENGSPTQPQT